MGTNIGQRLQNILPCDDIFLLFVLPQGLDSMGLKHTWTLIELKTKGMFVGACDVRNVVAPWPGSGRGMYGGSK